MTEDRGSNANVQDVDVKLEVVVIPVWDVDRAKQFYGRLGSLSDLANAMRRAEAAHGEHENRTGEHDANRPDWYAAYIVAAQTGGGLPASPGGAGK